MLKRNNYFQILENAGLYDSVETFCIETISPVEYAEKCQRIDQDPLCYSDSIIEIEDIIDAHQIIEEPEEEEEEEKFNDINVSNSLNLLKRYSCKLGLTFLKEFSKVENSFRSELIKN